jgi:hypothetical protein
MVGGRWRSLVVGVLGTLLVTGCANTIGGSAVSPPGATRPSQAAGKASAADLLGPFTSIDPCSLTDPAVFARFGTAKLGVLDSLDECLIEVTTSAPDPVVVYVGSLDHVDALPDYRGKRATDLPGGLTLVDYEDDQTYCSKLLAFTDGITLTVSATLYDGTATNLCDLVRAGLDKVVEVVRDKKVQHRTFAPNSLAAIDPCATVDRAVLAAVPGLGDVEPKVYPGKHNCLWAGSDAVSGPRLRVMFAVGIPPTPTGEGATAPAIAGRGSVVSPSPNAGSNVYCFVETAHIPFQPGVSEKALVSVRLAKGQLDAACAAATAVASAVWPKLPIP